MPKRDDPEMTTRYADMFSAMGTEPRLRIIRLLLSAHPGGLVVGEIGTELNIPSSTLSHHLDKLKNEDLVRVRREWRKVHTEYDDSIGAHSEGADDAVFQRDRANPEQHAQSRQIGQAIDRALETLPEEQKAVLVMREVDGLSYQEMAEVMGCSIGTIMSRLFYARKKMQAALKGLEVKR